MFFLDYFKVNFDTLNQVDTICTSRLFSTRLRLPLLFSPYHLTHSSNAARRLEAYDARRHEVHRFERSHCKIRSIFFLFILFILCNETKKKI